MRGPREQELVTRSASIVRAGLLLDRGKVVAADDDAVDLQDGRCHPSIATLRESPHGADGKVTHIPSEVAPIVQVVLLQRNVVANEERTRHVAIDAYCLRDHPRRANAVRVRGRAEQEDCARERNAYQQLSHGCFSFGRVFIV